MLDLWSLVHLVLGTGRKVGHVGLGLGEIDVFLAGNIRCSSLFSTVGRDIAGEDWRKREVDGNVAVPAYLSAWSTTG
jgi:hypothetical protein